MSTPATKARCTLAALVRVITPRRRPRPPHDMDGPLRVLARSLQRWPADGPPTA